MLDYEIQPIHLDMQPTTPEVEQAMVAARAGLGLLAQHGVTHAQLREAVFNGFRSHEEAEEDGFDMSDSAQCILGRAIGDYTCGADLLGLSVNEDDTESNRRAVQHGFLVVTSDDPAYDSTYIFNYEDLAQAWERILVPEWWAQPKVKTLRVMVDVVVPEDANNAQIAYSVRDTIEYAKIDRGEPSQGEWSEVSLYTWETVEDGGWDE